MEHSNELGAKINNETYFSELNTAITNGDIDSVKTLLKNVSNLNYINYERYYYNFCYALTRISHNNATVEIVSHFLDNKIDISPNGECSALQYVIDHEHLSPDVKSALEQKRDDRLLFIGAFDQKYTSFVRTFERNEIDPLRILNGHKTLAKRLKQGKTLKINKYKRDMYLQTGNKNTMMRNEL